MDLLNYQYLDKMNNNIGILCYEGNNQALTFSLQVNINNEMKYLVKITDAGDVIALLTHRVSLGFVYFVYFQKITSFRRSPEFVCSVMLQLEREKSVVNF